MAEINEINEIKTLLEGLVTDQGLKVSGNGILAQNTKKMIEVLDKIQRLLYFMEKRQQEMFEFMKNQKV